MEYASGGELYDYLSERKILQDGEARRIFRQVASAVYYCHKVRFPTHGCDAFTIFLMRMVSYIYCLQHKICHRDLKLENILLDEKANAKVISSSIAVAHQS